MTAARYDNILETVGKTPVVKLNKIAPEGVNVFVKIESFNPMGSVKDRLALGVIEDAEKSLPRRQGRVDAGCAQGQRYAGQGRRTGRKARLVPRPAV